MIFWQISGNYAIFQTHLDLLDLILGRIAHFSLEKFRNRQLLWQCRPLWRGIKARVVKKLG